MPHSINVSIIIPCYNAAKTLAATLDSVLAQTYRDYEVIVINDGSTDESGTIARHYAERDPRIQVHTINNNGVSHARNLGVQIAQGEVFAFLDADDFWTPEKLMVHVNHLRDHPEVGISFAKIQFLTMEAEATGTFSKGPFRRTEAEQVLYENPTCTCSNLVVRKEVFEDAGGFDESMSFAEDQEWLFRVVSQTGWHMVGIEWMLVRYRASAGGLSASLEKMEAGWEKMVQQIRRYAPEFVTQHYPHARAIYLRYLARRALRLRRSPHVAWQYQKRALASDWRILFTEPRRSLLTLFGVLLYQVFGRHKPETVTPQAG